MAKCVLCDIDAIPGRRTCGIPGHAEYEDAWMENRLLNRGVSYTSRRRALASGDVLQVTVLNLDCRL